MMFPPSVTLSQASLSYQGEFLFKNLNLTLGAGSWTVLAGPSGVGKTSLLRLFAGLQTNATTLHPIQCSDGLPLQNRIAYLAQHDVLLPWFNVLDNVLIGQRLRGEKIQTQAVELLQRVGLGKYLNKKPGALSGGMRQRVQLVRTLIEDRPVVLMDEPFSAVDVITRLELQELAAELLVNRTVLLITHDPLEALRLGDFVYVMTGKPAILEEPLQPQGLKPRAVTDPTLLQLQGELLLRLENAKKAMPW